MPQLMVFEDLPHYLAMRPRTKGPCGSRRSPGYEVAFAVVVDSSFRMLATVYCFEICVAE
jgi:hypothetical protein